MTNESKCNILNDYFVSVSTIDDTNNDVPEIELRTDATITDIPFQVDDIIDILMSLNVNKAVGNDAISHNMLTNTALSIAYPLYLIFRASLEAGHFPKQWKLTLIMPSFKKGDKHVSSNYRPIALLVLLVKSLNG